MANIFDSEHLNRYRDTRNDSDRMNSLLRDEISSVLSRCSSGEQDEIISHFYQAQGIVGESSALRSTAYKIQRMSDMSPEFARRTGWRAKGNWNNWWDDTLANSWELQETKAYSAAMTRPHGNGTYPSYPSYHNAADIDLEIIRSVQASDHEYILDSVMQRSPAIRNYLERFQKDDYAVFVLSNLNTKLTETTHFGAASRPVCNVLTTLKMLSVVPSVMRTIVAHKFSTREIFGLVVFRPVPKLEGEAHNSVVNIKDFLEIGNKLQNYSEIVNRNVAIGFDDVVIDGLTITQRLRYVRDIMKRIGQDNLKIKSLTMGVDLWLPFTVKAPQLKIFLDRQIVGANQEGTIMTIQQDPKINLLDENAIGAVELAVQVRQDVHEILTPLDHLVELDFQMDERAQKKRQFVKLKLAVSSLRDFKRPLGRYVRSITADPVVLIQLYRNVIEDSLVNDPDSFMLITPTAISERRPLSF